jgi:hypothetical protein
MLEVASEWKAARYATLVARCVASAMNGLLVKGKYPPSEERPGYIYIDDGELPAVQR